MAIGGSNAAGEACAQQHFAKRLTDPAGVRQPRLNTQHPTPPWRRTTAITIHWSATVALDACAGWINRSAWLRWRRRCSASSERTLMRRFRQALGDTPLRHLQQQRLFAARRLLETTTLDIGAIAQRVGYQDTGAFRKPFTRELHCAPARISTALCPSVLPDAVFKV